VPLFPLQEALHVVLFLCQVLDAGAVGIGRHLHPGPHLAVDLHHHLDAVPGEGCGIKYRPACIDDISLPAQDLVLCTLKATALPASADALAQLVGKRGTAVFFVNGIPWWWRHGTPDPGPLTLLDPQEQLWKMTLKGGVFHFASFKAPAVTLEKDDTTDPDMERHAVLMRKMALSQRAMAESKGKKR